MYYCTSHIFVDWTNAPQIYKTLKVNIRLYVKWLDRLLLAESTRSLDNELTQWASDFDAFIPSSVAE